MKKKLFSIAVVAAIAIAGAWSVNQSNEELNLTDIISENVDALASVKPPEGCWYTMNDDDCKPQGKIGCACI